MSTLSTDGSYAQIRLELVDGISLADAPAMGRGRFAVTARTSSGPEVVLPATDAAGGRDEMIRSAMEDPGAFCGDRDALRVELWMVPTGWNEGHEVCRDPMVCLFAAPGTDVSAVRERVAAAGRRHVWTEFEVRVCPAGSGAPQQDADEIAAAMVEFIETRARWYIP